MARPFNVSDLYGLYRTYEQGQRAGDESYNPALNSGFMSESQFNALPEQERMRLAGQYTNGGTNVYDDGSGNLVGYGDPRFIEQGGWYNPSGMTTGENGRFSINRDSVNQDALNDIQNATDRSGFFSGTPLQNIMRGAGIVLGAGGLSNWLMDGSLLGSSAAATAGSGAAVPAGMEGLAAGGAGAGLTPAAYAGLGGEFATAAGLGGAAAGGGLLSQAAQWIASNPLTAGRMALSGATALSGLLGNRGAGATNRGGGSQWNAQGGLLGGNLRGNGQGGQGSGQGGNSMPSGYAPNPYTVAQLNRLYGGGF